MARAKGFTGIIGLKHAVTWGTAIACVAGDALIAATIKPGGSGPEAIMDPGITGRVTMRAPQGGNKKTTVVLETPLRYEGLEPTIALLFGTAGAPSTVDTTAKLHVFKVKDNIDSIFQTIAYLYLAATKVAELQSVKWNKLTLKGSAKDTRPIMLTMEGIAYDWTDASVINTVATLASVTAPANASALNAAVFKHVVFSQNAQAGAGLAGGDVTYVEDFEITFDRKLEARFSSQFGDKTDEPLETGFAELSLKVSFPAIQDAPGSSNMALFADQQAFSQKKGKLVISLPAPFAGSVSAPYMHTLWFPMMSPKPQKPGIEGPQAPHWTQEWILNHVTAVPTGFTAGYLDAITWEAQSQRATDALV